MIALLLAPHAVFLAIHCVIAWRQRGVRRAVGEGRAEGDLEFWTRLGYGASVAHYLASFGIGMIALNLVDGLPAFVGFAVGFSGWLAFRLSGLRTDAPGRLVLVADPGLVRDAWIARFLSTLWCMIPFAVVVLAYHVDRETVHVSLIGLFFFRLLLDFTHPSFIGWMLRPYLYGFRSRRRWQIVEEDSVLGGEFRRMQAACIRVARKPPRVRIDPSAAGSVEPDWNYLRKGTGEGEISVPQRLFQELDPDALTAAIALELGPIRSRSELLTAPDFPIVRHPQGLAFVALAMLAVFGSAYIYYPKTLSGESPATALLYGTVGLLCFGYLMAETRRRSPADEFVLLVHAWKIWTWQPLPESIAQEARPGEWRRQAFGGLLLMIAGLTVLWLLLSSLGLSSRWIGILMGGIGGIGLFMIRRAVFPGDVLVPAERPQPEGQEATHSPLPRTRAPEEFIAALARADASRVRDEDRRTLPLLTLGNPVVRGFLAATSPAPVAAEAHLRELLTADRP